MDREDMKDFTEKAFDKVEEYSGPQFALPVISLGLIFLQLFGRSSF
jgi:hypothetical protein